MKYFVDIQIPNYEDEYNVEYEASQSIEDILENAIDDLIANTDFFYDAFANYTTQPIGFISEVEAENAVYEGAVKYINTLGDELQICVYQLNDDGHRILLQKNDVKQRLIDRVYEETTCGEFDAKASGYVENCLLKYASVSHWYVIKQPEKEYPLLWFGPSEKIDNKCWLIDPNKEIDLSFWFTEDEWSLIHYMGITDDDCFLVWYFAECGCCVPEIEPIRNACPIVLDESDSREQIIAKLCDLQGE